MPRNCSEAVPEGNGIVLQQEEFGSDEPTLADVYRIIEALLDKSDRKLDELAEGMKVTDQRLANLEQDARQPRFAMEENVPADEKTCERTEGTAREVQAVYGYSCSANRVDPDPMCANIFGDDSTGPPALPCSWEDAHVGNGRCPCGQRRCGAQVMSLTLGDTLTNSRRWLTSRRQSLYNDEDHLLSAASSVQPNRGDKF